MFFAPDGAASEADLVNFIGYCLAHAANECGVLVHASVVMSDHHHTDVSDPLGNLASFKQRFHSMLARGINKLRGRCDTVWSGDGPRDTRRPTDETSFGDVVYTLTNPVKHGLVPQSELWPGFTTFGWRFGESRTFARPKWFFDPDGRMPDEVSLTLARPPVYPELDDEDLFEVLLLAVRARERTLGDQHRRANRRFMGLRKVRAQPWSRSASSFEERFVRAPRHGTLDPALAQIERSRDHAWRREYVDARTDLLDGGEPVFPHGTDWMRRFAGVTVGPAPP